MDFHLCPAPRIFILAPPRWKIRRPEHPWSPKCIIGETPLIILATKSQQKFRSMEAAIPMVKKTISDLVKSAPKIPTWVLTSIKDPEVKLVRKTADVEELKRDLDALDHNGDPRDDPKEQVLKGNL